MDDATQLNDFLEVLANYAPTVPEEVVEYYLQQSGFNTSDPRLVRMVALAAHKFLLDVSHDALQYQRIRAQSSSSSASSAATATGASATSAAALMAANGGANSASNRVVLTMEDLAASLKEYGVSICKPEYVSDVAHES
uniref:Transcription initiation factor TFIID subunit 10 n=1 Tax=Globisporangium ultimum (strain ATCC 200006 / CBS 805.95 / DAOM BR144) TaxID=431595 RepID=K3W652_GLOUD